MDWHCQFCGRFFKSPRNCATHRKICKKNPRKHDTKFECQECGHTVKTKAGLNAHIKAKHGPEKLFKCLQPKCKKEYANLSSLRRHCDGENHKFPEIEVSLNKKEDKKNEKCKICHKYIRHWNMDKHMKKHNLEPKKFHCNKCTYKSNRSDNLLRHKESKHKMVNLDLDAIRKFPFEDQTYACGECEMELSSEEEMEDHMALKSCQKLICEICDKQFTMKANLKQHIKKFHK